jgi:hypothetical protein
VPVINNQRIQKISECLDLNRHCSDKCYHNAAKLLHLYRGVRWRLEQSLDDIEDECLDAGGRALKETLGDLLDMDTDLDKLNLEDRLNSLTVNHQLIEIIDKSLVMLKKYPYGGEHYYDILNKSFIVAYPYSETEILEALNVSRTTYYNHRKKAISMMGVVLWGFVVPELIAI